MDQGPVFLSHHIKIMKVALALAIIRQKPEGVSAKDYTSHLALQFSQLQTNWRDKATQLERELLRTRQELATYQVRCELVAGNDLHTHPHPSHVHPLHPSHDYTSHPYINAVHGNVAQASHELHSQDQGISTQGSDFNHDTNAVAMDSEWTSSGYSSSLTQEANKTGGENLERTTWKQNALNRETAGLAGMTKPDGCSLDNHSIPMDSENARSKGCTEHAQLSKHTGALNLSDSCNQLSDEECSDGKRDALQERVRAHVKFCTSVSALATVRGQLSDLVTYDLRDTLHKTISDALNGLTNSIHSEYCLLSGLPLSKDAFECAATCIVESIQLPLLSPFEPELTDSCVALVAAVIEQMVQHKGVNKSHQSSFHSVLTILCGLPEVFRHGLTLIVKVVVKCALNLEQALDDVDSLDIDLVENIGLLIQTTETLLTKYDVTLLGEEVCCHLIDELEFSLSGLVESFPLFSYSVWKLIGYLHSYVPI